MSTIDSQPRLANALRINDVCDQFEAAWKRGEVPDLKRFVALVDAGSQSRLLAELWQLELHYRRDEMGKPLTEAELRLLHPALVDRIDATRATRVDGGTVELSLEPPLRVPQGLHIRCPHCSSPVELLADAPADDVSCHACGSTFSLVGDDSREHEARSLQKVGRFELQARLGVGGFGTVWKARDTELDRVVALKIPRRGNLNSREAQQFLREARAAAQLRHPHIVPVFEIVREDDLLIIVSEYVRGQSLAQWMAEASPTARDIASICVPLCEALHCAHEAGIVHRDLKPSNVMIDSAGRPRLMDFGLAKREVGEITMTYDGLVLGTPAYMSPEQARGEAHWTDRRTDVYSLGAMMFHLLTGELPFRGAAAAQIEARLKEDPPDPRTLNRHISADIATICLKCMEQSLERRYQTAAVVGEELQRFLDGVPIVARPITSLARGLKWASRNVALSVALALGAILAVAGPVAAVWIDMQRRETATRLEEREHLVAQREREKVDLQGQLAAIRLRLANLQGRTQRDSTVTWQRTVIRDVLNAKLSAYTEQLATIDDPRERAEAQSALGQLLAADDRVPDAVELWIAAYPDLTDEEQLAVGLKIADAALERQQNALASEWLTRAKALAAKLDRPVDALGITIRQQSLIEGEREPSALLQVDRSRRAVEQSWPDNVADLPDFVTAMPSP